MIKHIQAGQESLILGAVEAGEKISEGSISASEYVEQLLKRADAMGHLNAFTFLNREALLQDTKKLDQNCRKSLSMPLLGVPIGIKSNIDVAGMPTNAGTAALKNHIPDRTAPAVTALTTAGALVAGKLNMHELAFGVTSNNGVFGEVRNPYNVKHVAGGSSGGNAAAIAAGIIPAALGTDTGGSTRGPAALCGIVGMRPTIWRYPQAGVVPISHTRDTIGPMARNVKDVVCLDGLITGEPLHIEPANLGNLRLGMPDTFYDNLHPDIERKMEQVLDMLRQLGTTIVKIDVSDMTSLASEVSMPICFYEVLRDIPRYLSKTNASTTLEDIVAQIGSPDVRGIFDILMNEDRVGERDYYDVMAIKRPALRAACRHHFKEHKLDAFVFPTTRLPAPLIEDHIETVHNGQTISTFQALILNTDYAGSADMPGVTIPIGLTQDGLPIGIEFDGLPGTDRKLLSIVTALEAQLPPMPLPDFLSF
ncbi:MAG: indole acetimide hydrolase [Robiginitomaculum sp.]|nr:MAG: indole acetimide hydrolase [Robiginitomaculum sp.]